MAHRMDNFDGSAVDSVIVGNFSETKPANLSIFVVQEGTNLESP